MSKKLIWFGLVVGSFVGGYVPALWGDSIFSFWSFLLSAVGAILGIWIGFKISKIIDGY